MTWCLNTQTVQRVVKKKRKLLEFSKYMYHLLKVTCRCLLFKGDLLCFFVLSFPFFQCVYVLVNVNVKECKRFCKLKRPKSTPPLSHRKHCSWNASSVVPPLIPWLCAITLCHRAIQSGYLCLAAILAHKIWFSTAPLLLSVVLAQACVSWPIRADCVFVRRGLKKTGAKTGQGEIQCCSNGQNEKNWCVLSTETCKSTLVLT